MTNRPGPGGGEEISTARTPPREWPLSGRRLRAVGMNCFRKWDGCVCRSGCRLALSHLVGVMMVDGCSAAVQCGWNAVRDVRGICSFAGVVSACESFKIGPCWPSLVAIALALGVLHFALTGGRRSTPRPELPTVCLGLVIGLRRLVLVIRVGWPSLLWARVGSMGPGAGGRRPGRGMREGPTPWWRGPFSGVLVRGCWRAWPVPTCGWRPGWRG